MGRLVILPLENHQKLAATRISKYYNNGRRRAKMSKREKIERIIGTVILSGFAVVIGIFSGVFFAAPKKETTPNGRK